MAAPRSQPRPRRKKPVSDLVTAAKSEGHPDNYTGKREHTRYPTGMRLELTLDPSKPEETAPVVMHNVSEGGFAFWFRRQLEPRTTVHLRQNHGRACGEWLPAMVRHCTRGLLGYLVGAEFEGAAADAAGESTGDTAGRPANRTVDSKAAHLRRLVRRQLAAKAGGRRQGR